MAPRLRGSGDVRLAVVVDLRLVLAVRRAEAAQRAAVELPDQRPLVLKHGDGRPPHEPGSARVRAAPRAAPATPRSAALREPAPDAGGRATPQEKNVLSPWKPHSVASFAAGNTTHGDPARFFARRGRSPQGAASERRALGWNLRKSQSRRSGFAVFRARVKEIPRSRKLSAFQDVTNSACGSRRLEFPAGCPSTSTIGTRTSPSAQGAGTQGCSRPFDLSTHQERSSQILWHERFAVRRSAEDRPGGCATLEELALKWYTAGHPI